MFINTFYHGLTAYVRKKGEIMLTSYFTVKNYGEHEISIQKSRFIGYVKRVETEEEAQSFIQSIQKKHHDATHNCFAYMIGDNNQIQKANDDGEPSGTAGIPILEVIKRQNLKNTAVVVTRYFGGIKLGAGGLIRAYSQTTAEAIKATGVVKRELMQGIAIKVDYTFIGQLENELRNSEHIIDSIDYQEKVTFNIYVQDGEEEACKKWIIDLTSDNVSFEILDSAYIEKEVDSTKE